MPPPSATLFPYTTLFRSGRLDREAHGGDGEVADVGADDDPVRSEEHTSELQSLRQLVCRLLLEKKNVGISHSTVLPLSVPPGEALTKSAELESVALIVTP